MCIQNYFYYKNYALSFVRKNRLPLLIIEKNDFYPWFKRLCISKDGKIILIIFENSIEMG